MPVFWLLNDMLSKSLCVFIPTIFMESLSQEILTVAPVTILSAGGRGGTTHRAPIKRGHFHVHRATLGHLSDQPPNGPHRIPKSWWQTT